MHQRPSDENNIHRRAEHTLFYLLRLHLKRDSYSNYLAFCIFHTTKAQQTAARIGWRGVCESGFICALNGALGLRISLSLSFAPKLAHIKCVYVLQKALA
jgi:hypothetical protein